ncbi:MAG: type III pantothenate kinase [Lentisphaeria bacterium]|nr:type III pantothenate kinase [Lentisphaeria bacterium]
MYRFSHGIQSNRKQTLIYPLLINIGNTSAQFAFPEGAEVIIPTVAFVNGAAPEFVGEWPVFWLAASVVPNAKQRLEALAGEHEARLHWLCHEDLVGIDCSRVDMTTVGADRLANIAAAAAALDLPAMVIDCGTAITTEVVLPGPAFSGGAILPGRRMQRQALARFTGLLPDVPLGSTIPPAIGQSTPQAIMAGIDAGTLGTVERLIQSTIDELDLGRVTIVGTGGDADFFIQHSPRITRAPNSFTILGLRAIAETITWSNQPM